MAFASARTPMRFSSLGGEKYGTGVWHSAGVWHG
jgi:hypothetical protein